MPPDCVSLRPVTTLVSGDSPSSDATSGRTVPTIASRGSSSGSFSASISENSRSLGWYPVTFNVRLSVTRNMNAVH